MPSLRLSIEDSRDIASYLMTQKHADMTYAAASYMDDPKLAADGKDLVRHFGCAGCHEISGLEDEGRIGTELTNEGSKPIERLDFALWTEDAKRGVLPDGKPNIRQGKQIAWFDSKGFFEEKMKNPAVYDQGKYHANPMDTLRMPKPNLQSRRKSKRSSPCFSAAPIPLSRPNICTGPRIAAVTFKTAGGSSQNIIASAATRLMSAKSPSS